MKTFRTLLNSFVFSSQCTGEPLYVGIAVFSPSRSHFPLGKLYLAITSFGSSAEEKIRTKTSESNW